jgi:hypothetical protein
MSEDVAKAILETQSHLQLAKAKGERELAAIYERHLDILRNRRDELRKQDNAKRLADGAEAMAEEYEDDEANDG